MTYLFLIKVLRISPICLFLSSTLFNFLNRLFYLQKSSLSVVKIVFQSYAHMFLFFFI